MTVEIVAEIYMKPVEIVGQRVFCIVACAETSVPKEEVEREVNRLVPAGTSAGWNAPEFWNNDEADGPNPHPKCDEHPGRVHWYLSC